MSDLANLSTQALLQRVRKCDICADQLDHGVRPVLQVGKNARILIAGQAPGSKVHRTGIPFDDPSGERLRDWLGVTKEVFYDPQQIAILPMGFCYPGKGRSGDLAPRAECADQWRTDVLARMPDIQLTLIIGQYAMKWHLPTLKNQTLTSIVEGWRDHWPENMPLPHPSPRNNRWLSRNPWFDKEVLPALKNRVKELL